MAFSSHPMHFPNPQAQPHSPIGQDLGRGPFQGGRGPLRTFPRPQPNCRITSTDDGILQDKIKINCDCTCDYEQTDTVILGRDTSIQNCDARQMNEINRLRRAAGR
jgi:hypothetical protein